MTLRIADLATTRFDDVEHRYDHASTMLYAQSIGLGRDALHPQELPFVSDQGQPLRTVPTMATVLVPEMIPAGLGWDYAQVLHAEQRMQLYRPLPASAALTISKRIVDIFDRGPRLGALVVFEAEGYLSKDGTALFSVGSTVIARADGGFGGNPGKGPEPHRVPRRAPDLSCVSRTRPDQALLFRLNGDSNPLHTDPGAARAAGFETPIMHGLCTYGIACHAILQTICNYDETLITGFDARFSAPVFPGDVIHTDMWQEGNIVSFQCSVPQRGQVVIRNGKCTLAA